ncbi:hypothetical protein [Defluviitalea raffinosedens]|uniref:hypothetical protein n=1 Tax=Defluviitalea raffinosedens TaxID=1450156 RepID=UPI00195DA4F2|nr:hypothetical protein [Defluviitalea raffinosedens]MBM7685887.1 hypothetical protein [Defluviitalea raffinosedens]
MKKIDKFLSIAFTLTFLITSFPHITYAQDVLSSFNNEQLEVNRDTTQDVEIEDDLKEINGEDLLLLKVYMSL